jgi:hypothetical protein
MDPSRAVQPAVGNLRTMTLGLKLLLGGAVLGVVALAVAIHLFGPEFAQAIHGGKLWPW